MTAIETPYITGANSKTQPRFCPFRRLATPSDATMPPNPAIIASQPTSDGSEPYRSYAKTGTNILNGIESIATTID